MWAKYRCYEIYTIPAACSEGLRHGHGRCGSRVSGGTIAFISGIYEELIESIKSVNGTAVRLLGTLRLKEFWRHVNGRFLLPVLIGIGIAIFSLARLMTYLLTHHPIAIWSFFFGLIVASALLVARQIGHWNVRTVAACLVGAAAAWWITIATPTETPDTWWFIMLSGAIAICAMILPGISGAFILLLLGKYQFIMQAVGDLNIPVIVIFVVGAVAGIISFSHLLSWLLKHWHDVTVAVLMGFMVGSLNKVWPWKEVVETYTDSHGKIMPLVESNVAPGRFEALTQQDALLAEAIVLCIVGFLAIYCIELAARIVVKNRRNSHAAFRTYRPAAGALRLGSLFRGEIRTRGDCRLHLFPLRTARKSGCWSACWRRLPDLCGFNVTIPYKREVMALLDDLSYDARLVGAVNCVRRTAGGRLVGHNTDVIGLRAAFDCLLGANSPRMPLVLGTGGASQAVQYVLAERGIPFDLVSRDAAKGNYTYDNLPCEAVEQSRLIVNASPVGTYPRRRCRAANPLRLSYARALPARPGIQPAPDPVPRPGAPARGAHTQRRGDVPPAGRGFVADMERINLKTKGI